MTRPTVVRFVLILMCYGLGYRAYPQPDNDSFARRIPVVGTDVRFTGFDLDATVEPGEPNPFPENGQFIHTLWWTWTAPDDGFLRCNPRGSSSGGLAVYTGNTLSGLTLQGRSRFGGLPFLPVTRGTAYQLVVGTFTEWPVYSAVWDLDLQFRTPVSNDSFDGRIRLAGDTVTVAGHNAGATQGPGEPGWFGTVWWEWTPQQSGIVSTIWSLSLPGHPFPMEGESVDHLKWISEVYGRGSWPVSGGKPVQLAVSSWDESGRSDFSLRLRVSPIVIVDPPDGTAHQDRSSLSLRLTGMPDDVTSLAVTADGFQTWSFDGRPTDLVLTNLPAGRLALWVLAHTADGFDLRSPTVTVFVRGGHDDLASAPEIPNGEIEVGGWFPGTTLEAGEPPLPQPANDGTGSLWWRWMAPADGWVTLENSGSGSLGFQVFSGDRVANLAEVFPEIAPPFQDSRQFLVVAGRTYRIRLWEVGGPSGWNRIRFGFLPSAGNDAFDRAEVLPSGRLLQLIPRAFSSCEPGEPGECPEGSGSRWYSWTPPANGRLWIRLYPSWSPDGPNFVSFFSGNSLAALDPMPAASTVEGAVVQRGEPYRIRFNTANNPGRPAPEGLSVWFTPFPMNDEFANRESLAGFEGERTGSNDEATSQPGEDSSSRSVWWTWTAPADGVLDVEVTPNTANPSGSYPEVRLWSGDALGILQLIPGSTAFERRMAAPVLSGQPVQIRVSDPRSPDISSPSSFRLRYRFHPAPANDSFANRRVLTGNPVVTRGTNWSARTVDSTDPIVNGLRGARTVWWEWTAPESGWLVVDTKVPRLVVFTGSRIDNLTVVPQAPALLRSIDTFTNPGSRFVKVNRGVRYLIQSGEWESQSSTLNLPFLEEGFPLALRLQQFALDFPTNQVSLPAGEPVILRIAPDPLETHGDLRAVTYITEVRSRYWVHNEVLVTSSTGPDYSVQVPLLSGIHRLQALSTNASGEILESAPVELRIVPPNDLFIHAQPISGRTVTLSDHFKGSTREPGEPVSGWGPAGTLWYRWTAPASGTARVFVQECSLEVFTGSSLGNLRLVSKFAGREFTFTAVRGTEYFLRVTESGPADEESSPQSLELSLATTVLSSPETGSRHPFGEPVVFSVETMETPGDLASVEYQVDALEPFVVTVPPFSFRWDGRVPGLHRVQCHPRLKSGEVLPPSERWFSIAPINDRIENSIVVNGVPDFLEGTLAGSSADGGSGGDVSFSWRAPADGMLILGTLGIFSLNLVTSTGPGTWEALPSRAPENALYRAWSVRQGLEYWISVQYPEPQFAPNPFQLPLHFYPPAVNNDFVRRLRLDGTEGETTASWVDSTLETGEPVRPSGVAHSVWWTWTPPDDGYVQFSFPDRNNSDDGIVPYVGESIDQLVPIPKLGGNANPVFPHQYPVQAGVPVQIALEERSDGVADLRWTWRLQRLPENDDFAKRIPVSGPRITLTGSTQGATLESAEPATGDSTLGSVWWSWTPGVDGEVWFEPLPSGGWEHHFSIFEGQALDSLVTVPVDYGSSPNRFEVRAGVTYQIRFRPSFGKIYGGPFSGKFEVKTTPSNDAFARREILQGTHLQVSGSNYRSSREFHEPQHAGVWGGRSVWYRWRAPATGTVRIAFGSWNGMVMAAYEGEDLESLRNVGNSTSGGVPEFTFMAEAGHEYALAVDGLLGMAWEFQFDLDLLVPQSPFLDLTVESETQWRLTARGLGAATWILESGDLRSEWYAMDELSSPDGTAQRFIEPGADSRNQYYRLRSKTP